MTQQWLENLRNFLFPKKCCLCGKKGELFNCCDEYYCSNCLCDHTKKLHFNAIIHPTNSFFYEKSKPHQLNNHEPLQQNSLIDSKYIVRDPKNKGSMQYSFGQNTHSKEEKRQKELEDGWRY